MLIDLQEKSLEDSLVNFAVNRSLKISPLIVYVAALPCENINVRKQALNDKSLQGSVAAYLRYGVVVNNQIKKGLLLSLRVEKNNG